MIVRFKTPVDLPVVKRRIQSVSSHVHSELTMTGKAQVAFSARIITGGMLLVHVIPVQMHDINTLPFPKNQSKARSNYFKR